MNQIKFLDYKATPGEKHLGIATILINNVIYFRFKISVGKNGGYFGNPASYKHTDQYGVESYIPAFGCESNMLNEEVQLCLKTNVNRILSSGQQSASVFSSQQNSPQPQVHAPQAQAYQQSFAMPPAANPGYQPQPMAQPAQQFPQTANPQVQAVMNQAIDGDEIPF